jgi:glucose-1-phosphate thymidylyltransferase
MVLQREPLGVVLTGGLGTRLRPLTPDLPKALVPLLNKPLVTYGLDLLAAMGLRELVVVVGGGDQRTGPTALGHAPVGSTVRLAEQPAPKGPGDAVASVGAALDGRVVVVLAVDTVLQGGDIQTQLDAFTASDDVAWLPLARTDRPSEMGIALLDGDHIVELEEKPREPKSDLACVGLWLLRPEAIERLRTDPLINAKGESDLTGTIATMLAEDRPVGGREFTGRWLDGGSLVGLLNAQSVLLRDLPPVAFATPGNRSEGAVMTESSVQVTGSELHGPVMLGKDVLIADCVLGPEVVVGDGARLRGVRLQRAMVAPGAHAEGGEYHDIVITSKGAIASAV